MPLPPESHQLRPDHVPTPFSAAQIRDASRAGRTIRLREEVPGQAPTFRRIVYIEVGAERAVQELQATDADGRPIGDPTRSTPAWLDLQWHASQPVDATSVAEVSLTLPFGEVECWLYTVRRPEAEVRFWFAKELPGMPVQSEEWVDGKLVGRTTMIAKDEAASA